MEQIAPPQLPLTSSLPGNDGLRTSHGQFNPLSLSITGLGAEYPPYNLIPADLDQLASKFYPETKAMQKICSINRFTGIDSRSSIGPADHPIANGETPPSIDTLCKVWLEYGVPLSVAAAKKAMKEAKINAADITHVVSTTCTNSANPGFDHYVAKELGLSNSVEKVLLHGVGCSGGLAALRTASNLALGARFRRRKARVLVLACEISTIMVRSEMDSIHENQETRIGVCLFSDCASSLILSNGIGNNGEDIRESAVYEYLSYDHRILPDTEHDLGFDVHPLGWKVVLSPRVPSLAQGSVAPAFKDLLASIPGLPEEYQKPEDFDWALHPGGATILTGVEKAMGISSEHLRASYATYMAHGNSSSATIISVMDLMRREEMDCMAPGGKVKDYVVGCAFGPGISVEVCLLKRNMQHGKGDPAAAPPRVATGLGGEITPPESDGSEGSQPDEGDAEKVKHTAETMDRKEKTLTEILEGVELD